MKVKKIIRFALITLLFTSTMVLSLSQARTKLPIKALTSDEMKLVVGATVCEDCTGTASCPTDYNTCSDVTCETTWAPAPINAWRCITLNWDGGCSSSGSYKYCEFDWWSYCDADGGSDRCGNYKRPVCQQYEYSPGFKCNGLCDNYTSSGSCKIDCI